LLLFFGFKFWDFTFHPVVNILLKSALLTVCYFGIVCKLKISEDVNALIARVF
jgi:hypothetical protein